MASSTDMIHFHIHCFYIVFVDVTITLFIVTNNLRIPLPLVSGSYEDIDIPSVNLKYCSRSKWLGLS